MVLILDENDVESLIDIPTTVKRMEEAFTELGNSKVSMPLRSKLSIPGSFGTLRIMPAALQASKISGLKILAGTAGHRRQNENYFLVLLYDYDDGALQCMISANRLTQLRTGALSAVATNKLARKDSKTIGLIGAGIQGRGQIEAICAVKKFESGLIFDVYPESSRQLASFGSSKLGVDFRAAESIQEVSENSDVLVTSTTSGAPFLNAAMVRRGTHINAIGSNLLTRKELDPDLLRVAKVIVDSKDQAIEESGDFEPIKQGVMPRETIFAELSEILVGAKTGRTSDSDITIFKSVGVALQDVAAAGLLYERAIAKGVGKQIKL
jgi:alanine dehydrogenase